MKLGRYPLVMAALAVFGILATSSATAAPAMKGPPAARHAHDVPGQLTSLSCASRSACFAITLARNDTRFGVIRITDRGAKSHTTLLKESLTPNDLSCPSPEGCEMLAQRRPSAAPVFVPVSAHDVIGKPIALGTAAGVSLANIACHPTRAHCTAVGGNGQTVDVVSVTDGTPTDHDLILPLSVAGIQINGVACPSATECYAIGAASIHNKEHGVVLPIDNGVPGTPVYVATASYDGIISIACTSSTTCVATGFSRFRTFIYALRDGKVTRTSKLASGVEMDGVACQSTHLCDAVGFKNSKGHQGGAVLPIRSGKPGKLQFTFITQQFTAGGGDGEGPVAGFRGGIEIIGFAKADGKTLICCS
jgi:hypothetical protein